MLRVSDHLSLSSSKVELFQLTDSSVREATSLGLVFRAVAI